MGYIYVLTNESMPNIVKIGLTERQPRERAKELNSTGVPTPFEVAAYWQVDGNLKFMEKRCHQLLNDFRISPNREFFKITVEEVVSILSPNFPTEEEIALEKVRKQKKAEAEKCLRDQIFQQRLKELEQRKLEQINILCQSIYELKSTISDIENLLSKHENIISQFLSIVQDGLVFVLITVFARAIPFILALIGIISGEGIFQKLLLAAGFYFIGIFGSMIFGAVSIVIISLIERLRKMIFGESHEQLNQRLSTKIQELKDKEVELSGLKS